MKLLLKQKPFVLLVIAVIACNLFGNSEPKSGLQYSLKVECKSADCDKIVEQTIKVLGSRAYSIGVSAKAVRKGENEIIFRIGDTKDIERVKQVLFSQGRLELLAVVSSPSPSAVQTYKTFDEAKAAMKEGEEVLPYLERSGEKEDGKTYVIIKANPIVANDDIRDAQAVSQTGDNNNYQIRFTLKPEGAAKFGNWTGANINQYMAVALNKEIKSIAYIKSQITDSGEISGRFTKESAEDLALILSSGRLPAPLQVLEEKTFGK